MTAKNIVSAIGLQATAVRFAKKYSKAQEPYTAIRARVTAEARQEGFSLEDSCDIAERTIRQIERWPLQ